jgi:hypothetical protein
VLEHILLHRTERNLVRAENSHQRVDRRRQLFEWDSLGDRLSLSLRLRLPLFRRLGLWRRFGLGLWRRFGLGLGNSGIARRRRRRGLAVFDGEQHRSVVAHWKQNVAPICLQTEELDPSQNSKKISILGSSTAKLLLSLGPVPLAVSVAVWSWLDSRLFFGAVMSGHFGQEWSARTMSPKIEMVMPRSAHFLSGEDFLCPWFDGQAERERFITQKYFIQL